MTKTYRNALVPVAAAFFALAAYADGGDVTLPVAYPQDESQVEQRTCAQALEDAAFRREMARTDGDPNPDATSVPECDGQKA